MRTPGGSVSLRDSLLVRLLATSVLVAVGSIGATAWLAVHTTTQAVGQQQAQQLSDDAQIYDGLLGYAATHPSWAGVQPTVADLAGRTGLRITLTTTDRTPVAGSAGAGPPAAADPSTVVDPLQVDPALSAGADDDRIDRRVVGPYLLSPAERMSLLSMAGSQVSCLSSNGFPARILETPGGRPQVQIVDEAHLGDRSQLVLQRCVRASFQVPTGTEAVALRRLNDLINTCLRERNLPPTTVGLDVTRVGGPAIVSSPAAKACVQSARREQLAGYTASPALLFVASPAGVTTSGFTLSSGNAARIAWVTAAVLVLTVGLTVLVGIRLVRPLRLLTSAARASVRQQVRVPVRRSDEIGTLAAAFNELSDRRAHAEQLRQAMVSDVAHELRTPLTNVRGWLEAVQDDVVAPDRRWVSSVLDEVLLLQHVIDDLQDLAVADAGELRLHPEPVRPADLLASVADGYGAAADAAGVLLVRQVGEDAELIGDPVRLRQALGNLVSNAIRHSPPGAAVTLAATADGEDLVLTVSDTGPGLSTEELPLVFDRFWRAEKSRNRHTGGRGLGLAIVRQLAVAHGGTATVTSQPGVATVFTLRLPLGGAQGATAVRRGPPGRSAEGSGSGRRGQPIRQHLGDPAVEPR
jgi:two-component system sensor histidine kinase BaeS